MTELSDRAEAALDALADEQDAVDRAASQKSAAFRASLARLLADPAARDAELWSTDLASLEAAGVVIDAEAVAVSSLEDWLTWPTADRNEAWMAGLRAMRAIAHRQAVCEVGLIDTTIATAIRARGKAAPLLRLSLSELRAAAKAGVSESRREAARGRYAAEE